MKLTMLIWVVCASTLAAGSRSVTEPEHPSELHSKPQPAAKGKRTFHPFGILRRLGKAETEFALRLSSWGIPREAEADQSRALPLPSPLTETAASISQAPPGGAAQ